MSKRKSRGDGIWIWGDHAVLAALANPERRCRRLLGTAEALEQHASAIAGAGIAAETASRRELDTFLENNGHQGLALNCAPLAGPTLEELADTAALMPGATIIILDQVTDPQNVGAILRSAAAFGAQGVLFPEHNSPEITGSLAKAASGALEKVPLVRVPNLVRALEVLKDAGFWTVGLHGRAERTLAETDAGGHVGLVLGAEGSGLRRLTREHCDHLARLPITGAVESLNVAAAAAVALYELATRR